MQALAMWIGWTGRGYIVYGVHPLQGVMLTKTATEDTGLPVDVKGVRERLLGQRAVGFISEEDHARLLGQVEEIEALEGDKAKFRRAAQIAFDALKSSGVAKGTLTLKECERSVLKDAEKYNAILDEQRKEMN